MTIDWPRHTLTGKEVGCRLTAWTISKMCCPSSMVTVSSCSSEVCLLYFYSRLKDEAINTTRSQFDLRIDISELISMVRLSS